LLNSGMSCSFFSSLYNSSKFSSCSVCSI
jgi:hypothetical protein